jgi:hypothetical protein
MYLLDKFFRRFLSSGTIEFSGEPAILRKGIPASTCSRARSLSLSLSPPPPSLSLSLSPFFLYTAALCTLFTRARARACVYVFIVCKRVSRCNGVLSRAMGAFPSLTYTHVVCARNRIRFLAPLTFRFLATFDFRPSSRFPLSTCSFLSLRRRRSRSKTQWK